MAKNIICFLLGVLFSTLSCIYFYSDIIHSLKQSITYLNESKFNLYRVMYADEVLNVIQMNNSSVHSLLEKPLDEESKRMAHLLLASSTVLNSMTAQDREARNNVFLTTALFYKRTENESYFEKAFPILKEQCEKDAILDDCSIENIKEVTDLIK